MKQFWKFINSPLIVVIIALSSWPLLLGLSGVYAMKIGVSQMVNAVKNDLINPLNATAKAQKEEEKKKSSYKESIKIENAGFGISDWESKQKVIATIKNGSSKTISSIHVTASYYDSSGRLIDVSQQWLSNLGSLSGGKEANITFDRSLGSMGESSKDIYKANTAASVKVEVADFQVLD